VKKNNIILLAVIVMLLLATILVSCSLPRRPTAQATEVPTAWLNTSPPSLPTVGLLEAPTVPPQPTATSPVTVLVLPTQLPTIMAIPPTATQAYPIYAQDVVQAFLTASPEVIQQYLSAAARSNLPATGALGLLMVSNPVQEFTIHSTSVSEASGGAVVLVEMKADGVQTIRIFNLIVENGVWVIHSIDFARG